MPASRPRWPRRVSSCSTAHQQVGELVDPDDQGWPAVGGAVSAFHLVDKPVQAVECCGRGAGNAAQDVGQGGQGAKTAAFGVDQHKLHLILAIVHGQRGQQGACQCGFARACGADHQHMGDIGGRQPQHQGRAVGFEPQNGGECRHPVESAAEREQPHRDRLGVGHLDLEGGAFSVDACFALVQFHGNLIGQRRDLVDFGGAVWDQPEAYKARSHLAALDPGLNVVSSQDGFDSIGLHFQRASAVSHRVCLIS
jgi:hypothetical protein